MSCVCNISKLLVDCLQNILLLMQGCSKLLLTCARRGVVVSAKWWFMYKELVEVAQNSLKKHGTNSCDDKICAVWSAVGWDSQKDGMPLWV